MEQFTGKETDYFSEMLREAIKEVATQCALMAETMAVKGTRSIPVKDGYGKLYASTSYLRLILGSRVDADLREDIDKLITSDDDVYKKVDTL